MSIQQRKKDHVELTAGGDMSYRKNTGFDQFEFVHNALPETNYDEADLQAKLMGRTFGYPLFISSMTGGYTKAGAVNGILAEFCEKHDLPLGVGSQRVMLEDPEATESFSIVRKKAPNAFIASNIGGAQLIGGLSKDALKLLVDSIEADAVIVHLNPLQELMQPEGDRNFKGIEEGIQKLVKDSPVPVIVKETGAGISGEVGTRLIQAGVSVIDTAGAGGTSWARVENNRASNTDPQRIFDDWGIPTVQCIGELASLKNDHELEIIASGGVRSGLDVIKALCLGADFAASAQPVIKAVIDNGRAGLEDLLANWKRQLAIALTLLGCRELSELGPNHLQRREGPA